jgi:hypothetical protein
VSSSNPKIALIEDGPMPGEFVDGLGYSLNEAQAAAEIVVQQSENIPTAELIQAFGAYRSWPFRTVRFFTKFFDRLLGFVSLTTLIAIVANIPIVQLLSFGYLLEASGRVARSGKLRDGFPGLDKASVIGRGALGTAICLIPLQLAANYWYSAYLIDPSSPQTTGLRILQFTLIALTLPHLMAAWFCGGQLKHFLWPLVAPFSLAIWIVRKTIGSRTLRPVLQWFTRLISPHLLEDIGQVQPLKRWFLPAVVVTHLAKGDLWTSASDRLWNFAATIPFRRLFTLGAVGFVGSLIWLFVPTCLLLVTTAGATGANIIAGVLGTMLATVVFAMLLPLQTQFAATGQFTMFFDLQHAWGRVRRAPIWHVLAVLVTLVLALPLFLAKIEEIPRELWWSLSLLYVVSGWLSRVALGFAYGRSLRRERPRAWWWAFPVIGLMLPISFSFVFIMFFTRYLSWDGAWSVIENPVFLLPAPFWL